MKKPALPYPTEPFPNIPDEIQSPRPVGKSVLIGIGLVAALFGMVNTLFVATPHLILALVSLEGIFSLAYVLIAIDIALIWIMIHVIFKCAWP